MTDYEKMGVTTELDADCTRFPMYHVRQGEVYLGRVWRSTVPPFFWGVVLREPLRGDGTDLSVHPRCDFLKYSPSIDDAVREIVVATDGFREGFGY